MATAQLAWSVHSWLGASLSMIRLSQIAVVDVKFDVEKFTDFVWDMAFPSELV